MGRRALDIEGCNREKPLRAQTRRDRIGLRIDNILPRAGQRSVAVIQGYLDESGTHRNATVLCVAGYFAPESRWHSFEREWRTILKDHGISRFHATERKSAPLKSHLATIIEGHKLRGVVCSVDPAVYNSNASGHLKSVIGNAYAACAFSCALEICKQAKEWYGERVALVFEAGQPNSDHIEDGIKAVRDDPIPAYAEIVGVTSASKDVLPLQAADFLAHSCGTHSQWFERLLGTRVVHAVLTSERLTEISKGIKGLISSQPRPSIDRMEA